MFLLSREIDATFNYMTASEIFLEGRFRAWKSFLIQRLGGYSVIRGSVDRDAFRTTRQLLQAGERPIVIFAEGGLTRQNDTVTPFESGVVNSVFGLLTTCVKLVNSNLFTLFLLGLNTFMTKIYGFA